MNYKKIYDFVVKNVCEKDQTEFDNIVEQEQPKFADKLIPNEKAPYRCLFSMVLDESVANEKDYRDFCEYIYGYIGMDFNEMVKQNKFNKFAKS